MTTYKVISEIVDGHKCGALVDADAFADFNVDAMIEGGHLETASNKHNQDKSQPKES